MSIPLISISLGLIPRRLRRRKARRVSMFIIPRCLRRGGLLHRSLPPPMTILTAALVFLLSTIRALFAAVAVAPTRSEYRLIILDGGRVLRNEGSARITGVCKITSSSPIAHAVCGSASGLRP